MQWVQLHMMVGDREVLTWVNLCQVRRITFVDPPKTANPYAMIEFGVQQGEMLLIGNPNDLAILRGFVAAQ